MFNIGNARALQGITNNIQGHEVAEAPQQSLRFNRFRGASDEGLLIAAYTSALGRMVTQIMV
jgi:hypothetical protein